MTATAPDPERFADTVRSALESADLDAIGALLDPDVYWGPPDDDTSGCHNRAEVLAFWAQSRAAGVRAIVTEVVLGAGTALVGLRVAGRDDAGGADRWQVLTLRNGLVADIRGYDDRAEAAKRAGVV